VILRTLDKLKPTIESFTDRIQNGNIAMPNETATQRQPTWDTH
jgi:hypothetical protein